MGLLDLNTDLKSLRYGRDRVGGGSSKEPFITQSIDSTPGDTGGPDFLLRANSLQSSLTDSSRMFDYLISPKGIQFALKQNLLSRTAVRAQASNGPINDGIYLPTSTLAQVATNAAGGHLLKQGINPFANTTANASNTGIGIVDNIANFLSDSLPLSAPFYAKKIEAIKEVKNNRLTQLVDYKLGVAAQSSNQFNSFLDNLVSGTGVGGFLGGVGGGLLNNLLATSPSAGQKYNSISLNKDEILRYDGGPGSALGIGQTSLKRVTDTNNKEQYILNYSELVAAGNSKTYKDQILADFRASQNPGDSNSVISTSYNYTNPNRRYEGRVNIGNPGRRDKNVSNYNFSAEGNLSALDKLTALQLYSSDKVINDANNVKNDLVKFRIGILDNNSDSAEGKKTYIHFRAFIDSFNDNYSAEWSEEKFMGRAEKFFRYGGFSRSINMSWTVVAQSLPELIPMYQKLNFLASSLGPDYSSNGYMQGNIAYLTFGGYCYEQPGIITSLTYDVPEQSPYEIDLSSTDTSGNGGKNTKELPHMIKVTGFQFKPIHNFVPRLQQNTYDGKTVGTNNSKFVSAWGDERYIALENEFGNNYDGGSGQSTFVVPGSKTEQENNQEGDTSRTEEAKGI